MESYHSSVLLKEVLDALNPVPYGTGRDAWYLDCTLGDGGHSIEIIKRGGRVVGIDVDPQALKRVQKRLKELGYLGILGKRIKLIQGNFRDLKNIILSSFAKATEDKQTDSPSLKLRRTSIEGLKFAGAIFDLGVSSLQLETPERGFSFSKNGPLDMRMDPTLGVKALDLVNVLSRKELYGLFKSLGEEKYSKRVVGALVSTRQIKPFETTLELALVIEKTIGRSGKIHPATKVFQALRIAVNDELDALQDGLNQVVDLIEKNGSILVISFHSLEDRIIKLTFRKWEDEGLGEILTKKPVVTTDDEIRANSRSRSAKMRVFKKL